MATNPAPQATATATASFPVLGLLGAVLVVLKALGYITWSWWWVLAPFWAPWAIIFAVLLVGLLIFVIGFTLDTIIDSRAASARRKRREQIRQNHRR